LLPYQDRIETQLQENPYSPGWYWLTIYSNFATKDQAIDTLIKNYNLNNMEVIAFGDNTNDIKMLKYASKGIAVENACPEVKDIADLIIGSNEDDSVIKYIANDNKLELIR